MLCDIHFLRRKEADESVINLAVSMNKWVITILASMYIYALTLGLVHGRLNRRDAVDKSVIKICAQKLLKEEKKAKNIVLSKRVAIASTVCPHECFCSIFFGNDHRMNIF